MKRLLSTKEPSAPVANSLYHGDGRRAVVATLLLAILVVGAFGIAGWLRNDGRLRQAGNGEMADYPPGVRFVTVALGGFRGLLADMLWLRAAQKQDEGLFFEVAQLSGWIARLEPRCPEIWTYHSWNIAYNIGTMFPDPADRWQWVQRGVRLLRDEGIPANPRSARLYWELAWLYSDKVSGRWEDDPLYFRVRMAADTMVLMGNAGSLERMGDDPGRMAGLASVGLLVDVMRQVEAEYGPLDWRLPEAHALYWGFRGRAYQEPGNVWCDRIVWISLKEMVGAGELYFDPAHRYYVRGPRLDLARRGVRSGQLAELAKVRLTSAVAENFLREAMVILYAFGDETGAGEARLALARLPEAKSRGMTLAAAVSAEMEERVRGVNGAQAREVLMGFLMRSEQWRRLDRTAVADGYLRLAALYRDALKGIMGPVSLELEGQWESLREEARERVK